MRYYGKNIRPFRTICNDNYGRDVIITNQDRIDSDNIITELEKAMAFHRQNAREIEYLDRYYRGDQPILYRRKANRPEVNNKIVENLAYMVVETKASEMAGEPIQYVLHGTDEYKSNQVANLNVIMEGEDKPYYDIELCRWRSICGTGYRFVGNDTGHGSLLDESEFYLSTEDPRKTFIVYYNDNRPAFSCQIREDVDGKTVYNLYTNSKYFKVVGNEIVDERINGNGAIPVIEYPNNARRLSDIEITISITDELNQMASDRANGIEQFVSAWVKFVNCEIDETTYKAMRQEGALVVKSNNGADNKADVDVISSELDQSQTQVAVEDQYEMLLNIQGIGNREGNTGGDTAGAVMLRDGYYAQEKRSELSEPIFIRSERQALRIVLNRLRIDKGFTLLPSDVEVHISRTKRDNMYTKAQTLQLLLQSGVNYERALKTVGLFSDPEQVALESKDRMEYLYPTEDKEVTADGNAELGQTEQQTDQSSGE